jgi:hypothetical protein
MKARTKKRGDDHREAMGSEFDRNQSSRHCGDKEEVDRRDPPVSGTEISQRGRDREQRGDDEGDDHDPPPACPRLGFAGV